METRRSMIDPIPDNPKWGDMWRNPHTNDTYRFTDGEWLFVNSIKPCPENIELQYCFDNGGTQKTYKDKNGWMYVREGNGPLYVCRAAVDLTRKQKIVKFLKKLWR